MSERSSGIIYALMAASVLAIALLGFLAFVRYLELNLAQFAGSGLLVLAIVAGTASFFSPCSFPLLVTLLARETGSESDSQKRAGKALRFATALAVGVTAFLILAGGLIAAGAGPVMRQVTFTSTPGRILRVAVGSLLVLLGTLQSRGIRFEAADQIQRPLQRAAAKLRRESPSFGFALFGFGYVLAGFG